MNRSFLIIFIPALLVAAAYLYMGFRPPARAEIGLAVFVAAVAAFRLKAMMQGRKAAASAAQAPAADSQAPAAPAAPKHS
jgi:hypothetical protein